MAAPEQYTHGPTNFLGITSRRNIAPVFWDPNMPMLNNRGPIAMVTGSPGKGKTYLLSVLAYMSIIMGKMTVIIDRKGDFYPLKQMEDYIGDVAYWDVSRRESYGLLDPFFLAPESVWDEKTKQFIKDTDNELKAKKIRLIKSVIQILIPTLDDSTLADIGSVAMDMLKNPDEPNPTMNDLVGELRGAANPMLQQQGKILRQIFDDDVAKIFAADQGTIPPPVKLSKGGTIIDISQIQDLPKTPEEASKSEQGRISTALMFLITRFVSSAMNTTGREPKLLMIDEAWAFLATQQGKDMVQHLALMSRSWNFGIILATQDYRHVSDNIHADTAFSTHFIFGNEEIAARKALEKLGRNDLDDLVPVVQTLAQGECLMYDFLGNLAVVRISQWWGDYEEFNTTPPPPERATEEEINIYV